jgi:hypothetical protein
MRAVVKVARARQHLRRLLFWRTKAAMGGEVERVDRLDARIATATERLDDAEAWLDHVIDYWREREAAESARGRPAQPPGRETRTKPE